MASSGANRRGDSIQNPGREGLLERWAKQGQREFEIEFFQAVLEKCPDYVEVLKAHGHNLTAKGHYGQGLEVDRRLVRLRPNDPVVHYNLACSYSLLQMSNAAIASLESSLKLGYRDFEHMVLDADLVHVRRDVRFLALIKRYWKRAQRSGQIC